jgi:hypothetical protein
MCLWPVAIFWHVVADIITAKYGPADPSQTTVRGKTDGQNNSHMSKIPKAVLRFYAFFQICALGTHLVPNARLMDLGYNPIIGVQSSAFLMTLFRKGLIKWYSHAFWYTLALLMAWTCFLTHMNTIYYMTLMCMCFYSRVTFGLSKYIIWTCYGIINLPTVEKYMFSHINSTTDLFWSQLKSNNVNTYGIEETDKLKYCYIYFVLFCVVMTINKVKAGSSRSEKTVKTA